MITKITIFIFFVAIGSSFAKSSYSQNTRLSLHMDNCTIQQVFDEIQKKSEFIIFYKDDQVNLDYRSNVDAEDATVDLILDQALKGSGLGYRIIDRQIVILPPDTKESPAVIKLETNAEQKKEISGSVKDSKGLTLPGVSVVVKGTTIGIITDTDGKFRLSVPTDAKTLVFSFVGMKSQEIIIGNRTSVKVVMEEELAEIEEVVAIGYGIQKKVNLTGSVATVSATELIMRPPTNAANLLQGKVAGLNITQPTGIPGADGPKFMIRGFGSYGASSTPLILIDGVQGDLNNISPNDIESVSVLKDAASASIYGSLAANGVILVTTKRGKAGKFNINYSSNYGIDQATKLPSLVYNSAEYMQMFNQARKHSGLPDVYTQDQINAYKNAPANSIEYPNFNWINYFFRNGSRQNQHVSINGGNDETTYNFSVGSLNQSGIIPSQLYHRLNTLLNVDSKISKTFKIGADVAFNYQYIRQPQETNDAIILVIYHHAPTYMPYLPDGSGRVANGDYPAAFQGQKSAIFPFYYGGNYSNYYEARSQAYVEANIVKGLTWMAKAAFDYVDHFDKNNSYDAIAYLYHKPDGASDYTITGNYKKLAVNENDDRNILLTAYSTLAYENTFDKAHHLRAMVGYEQKSFRDDNLGGIRNTFPSNILTEINAASSSGQSTSGDASEWALRSYFGRLNYSFLDKYLLEANFRYDGSSRLSPKGRWGLFPSFAGGWLLNKENFMKDVSWLNELKLRGSYGKLGNQLIGNYPYQSLYNVVKYSFGSLEQGAQLNAMVDPNIKWETTNVLDFGTDINIRNGLFTATIDWFKKKTNGILVPLTVPANVGLSGPTTNYGVMQNVGWEFNIGHSNAIGEDFRYGMNVIFSTYQNKVLQLSGGTQDMGGYLNKVGLPYRSYYLTQWIGIFQSQDEINNSPTQPYTPKPGDLKYKDVSGPDGKPDGKVNALDRVVTKGAFPDFTYSFNINLTYKNWGLTAFFQGTQGVNSYVNGWGAEPSFIQASPPQTYFLNAWTPQNHSQTIPALYVNGYAPVQSTRSTYFLQDASYLRLKNLLISYSLPTNIASKIKMKQVVIYVSGDNLLTFTKYRGADPETALIGTDGRFAQYPQISTYSAGININF